MQCEVQSTDLAGVFCPGHGADPLECCVPGAEASMPASCVPLCRRFCSCCQDALGATRVAASVAMGLPAQSICLPRTRQLAEALGQWGPAASQVMGPSPLEHARSMVDIRQEAETKPAVETPEVSRSVADVIGAHRTPHAAEPGPRCGEERTARIDGRAVTVTVACGPDGQPLEQGVGAEEDKEGEEGDEDGGVDDEDSEDAEQEGGDEQEGAAEDDEDEGGEGGKDDEGEEEEEGGGEADGAPSTAGSLQTPEDEATAYEEDAAAGPEGSSPHQPPVNVIGSQVVEEAGGFEAPSMALPSSGVAAAVPSAGGNDVVGNDEDSADDKDEDSADAEDEDSADDEDEDSADAEDEDSADDEDEDSADDEDEDSADDDDEDSADAEDEDSADDDDEDSADAEDEDSADDEDEDSADAEDEDSADDEDEDSADDEDEDSADDEDADDE